MAAAQDEPPPVLVSVIVPIFNVELYLDECLAGVCSQTYGALQIIAVDDGSTDNSGAILATWAARDPRIEVVSQDNGGLSAARNAGLERARGDYVCFVDSDDIPVPEYVATLLEVATRTGAPVVSCAINYLSPDGSQAYHSTFHAIERVAPYMDAGVVDLRDKRILAEFFPSAWNKLYRRDLFATLRFPVGLYYEDHPVFFAIGCAVDRWAYVPEPLYLQRRERPHSITSERSPRVFDILEILTQVFRILSTHLPPPQSLRMFKQVALRLLWERANSIADRALFEQFAAAGARLLHDTGVARLAPRAEDIWIPSAFARRLRTEAPPVLPFCSVVVTFADDAAFFEPLLEGLATQRLWDIEVILVDNGARDQSASMAEARCSRDPRFRLFRNGNGRLGAARNLGLEHARGGFIVFWEANDLVRPDGLERLFSYAMDEAADVVVSGFEYVRQDGVVYHSGFHRPVQTTARAGGPAKLQLQETGEELVADLLALPANKLFRRDFLVGRALRFEEDSYFEEHAFWCDVAAAAPRLVYSSEPLYRVRDEPAARRIWSGEAVAWEALSALSSLHPRLSRATYARLAVRLAWERLSFSLSEPADRARFAKAWRRLTGDYEWAELDACRDVYIDAAFVDEMATLAITPSETPAGGPGAALPV